MVWDIKIPKRQKAIICLISGLGAFASAASIVKMTYNINYGKTGDFLWDSTDLTIWGILEIDIAIITASIPTFKLLFKRIFEKTGYSGGSNRGLSNSHPLQSLHTPRVKTDISANSKSTRDKNTNDSEESIFAQAFNIGGLSGQPRLGWMWKILKTNIVLKIESYRGKFSFLNEQ
ncbi:hypothetical protein RUND412_001514 [Rhizina undulata]